MSRQVMESLQDVGFAITTLLTQMMIIHALNAAHGGIGLA